MSLPVVSFLVACSAAPTPKAIAPAIAPATLTVQAKEFSFSPAQLTVTAGQSVEVVMKNAGTLMHDFTIEKIKLKDKAVANGDEHKMDAMAGMDPDQLPVHVAAEQGHEGHVTFTPTEAGEYEFYCTVAGHKVSGMLGRLTVVAP